MTAAESQTSGRKFAWLTTPGSSERPAYDIVVAANDHFVAIPSLGAFVPGWMLLVPRRPMSTLTQMTVEERIALSALRYELCERLVTGDGDVFAFEHGGTYGSLVSCGVDQAHLHLVPLRFNLLDASRRHLTGWRQSVSISELSNADTGGREYLFVERSGVSLIAFPQTPTSQWFRQLIAQESGVCEWDYKQNPNLDQVRATAELLTARTTKLRRKKS